MPMRNEKSNRQKKLRLAAAGLAVVLAAGGLTVISEVCGLFRKLDYRMYDTLLAARKEPELSGRIVLLAVDDASIEALGEWPWPRDILGDALVRLREMDALSAVFDIEYISPSGKGISPSASDEIRYRIEEDGSLLSSLLSQMSDAVSGGMYTPAELPALTEDVINSYLMPSLSGLYEFISESIYRDNDDYFARAVQFFGNTWLTVNNRNLGYALTDADRSYVERRFFIDDVTDVKSLVPEGNRFTAAGLYDGMDSGFTPALHSIISRAAGAGFTNSVVDSDGIRRRMELLYEHDGRYLGQLVFAPFISECGVSALTRTGHSLVLHDARIPGTDRVSDIEIPLDRHGRMLINWRHGQLDAFPVVPVIRVLLLDQAEANIRILVSDIAGRSGYLMDGGGIPPAIADDAVRLESLLAGADRMKSSLLEKCTGFGPDGAAADGIAPDGYSGYFSLRREFFSSLDAFVESYCGGEYAGTLAALCAGAAEILGGDSAAHLLSDLTESLSSLKEELSFYEEENSALSELFRGKFCIIGNTATSTTDIGAVPFSRQYPNVGIHANLLNTLLTGDFIGTAPWFCCFIPVFILMLLAVLLSGKSVLVQNSAGAVVTAAAVLVPALVFVSGGFFIPFTGTAFFAVAAYTVSVFMRFLTVSGEKKFLKQAFAAYLSRDVVNQIIENPDRLRLGGEKKRMTALFTDIKGFSSFSELVTPEKLVSVLNGYLSVLSDRILERGGTIDKYIGDAIVSFFGAPVEYEDHAYRACVSAIEMKRIEDEFNRTGLADGTIPRELRTRIGINTGDMVVGNMGTSMKKNYTVMGNDVNLASRLEGVNKVYGTWITVSESTWKEADSGAHKGELVAKRLDRVRVVGINRPVQLYSLAGFRKDMTPAELEEMDIFHAALDLYLGHDFEAAGRMFRQAAAVSPDPAAEVFAARCARFARDGIPGGWDGVVSMTSK